MVIALRLHERNAMTFSTSRMLGIEAVNHASSLAKGKIELSTYKTSETVYKRFRRQQGTPCEEGEVQIRQMAMVIRGRQGCLTLKNLLILHFLFPDKSNQEIDVYQCLLDLAEKDAGCHLPIGSRRNRTTPLCEDMYPFQMAVARQATWTEAEMAANGCVPSCTRKIYKLELATKIVSPTKRMNALYGSTVCVVSVLRLALARLCFFKRV